MEGDLQAPAAQGADISRSGAAVWPRLAELVVLLALLVWHGWMTLTLFGPDRPWQRLLDDQPVVSGRHPLHLYHGYLGAHSFRERGTLCCFDPNFQAGYPKTPIFDGGSRPAELFLLLAGGTYRPAAYKVGLAVLCALVPLLLLVAARGAGLGRGTACLAVALGLLVWWGAGCQALLIAGDLDLLLAGLAAVAQAGLLIGFDRAPGLRGWLGLLLTGWLGWFAQPLLFALGLPLFLVYYFRVGGRHHLIWHLALLGGLAGGVAANAFWLTDWVGYWWLRIPLTFEASVPAPALDALWDAPLWGGAADRVFAVLVLVLALAGVWHLNHVHQRQAARFFGLGMAGLLLLALGGVLSEPLGRFRTDRLLTGALLFAAFPAAHALLVAVRSLCRWTGAAWRGALLAAGLLAAAGLAASEYVNAFAARCAGARPLEIGLGPEREVLVAALREHTTTEARILWEDRPLADTAAHWTALLAQRTGRAFLGGLDPQLGIEHAHAGFCDQVLAGRLIGDWSDAELDDFCRRYNVGWLVCWSRAAEQRLRTWKSARLVTQLDADGLRLYAVDRVPSYALKGGRVKWLHADSEHIALADVVPNESGEVVLSLHYQAGMQVSPSRVRLERELDPYDPIAFVRLRLNGPVMRVTLTWEKR
jgi:hypothetical protein